MAHWGWIVLVGALGGSFLITVASRERGLYVVMVLSGFQYYVQVRPGTTISLVECLAAGFVAGCASRSPVSGRLALKKSPLHLPIAVYLALNALYLVNSDLSSDVVKHVGRAVLIAAFYLSVFSSIRASERLDRILRAMIRLAVLSAIVQFTIYLCYKDMSSYFAFVRPMSELGIYPPRIPYQMMARYPVPRPGSYFDPYGGSYALYLLCLTPLTVSMALFQRRARHRLGLLLASGMLALAMLLSLSRTGIYALAGSLVVMVLLFKRWLSGKWMRYAVIFAVAVAVVFLAAPDYYRLRILSRTRDTRSSDLGRFGRYIARSFVLAADSPLLGGGLETFDKTSGGVLPHNGFLADFQSKGILGPLARICLFYAAFREMLVLRAKAGSPRSKTMLLWTTGGIGGFFLASFATTPLGEIQAALLFFTMLAVLARTRYLVAYTSTAAEQPERPGPRQVSKSDLASGSQPLIQGGVRAE